MRMTSIGLVAAAAAAMAAGARIGRVDVPKEDAKPLTGPTEPPPEVAQQFGQQSLRAARKQRWLEGHDIPEADRRALEAAAEKRRRRAEKRK